MDANIFCQLFQTVSKNLQIQHDSLVQEVREVQVAQQVPWVLADQLVRVVLEVLVIQELLHLPVRLHKGSKTVFRIKKKKLNKSKVKPIFRGVLLQQDVMWNLSGCHALISCSLFWDKIQMSFKLHHSQRSD